MERIKVYYAKIYVSGSEENPYYGIEYHSVDDNRIKCGFGSHSIEFVKIWIIEEFEFVHGSSEFELNFKDKENPRIVVDIHPWEVEK